MHPLDQLAKLNNWLAEYEPNLYWGTPDRDTADVIIDLLNRWTPNGTHQRAFRSYRESIEWTVETYPVDAIQVEGRPNTAST